MAQCERVVSTETMVWATRVVTRLIHFQFSQYCVLCIAASCGLSIFVYQHTHRYTSGRVPTFFENPVIFFTESRSCGSHGQQAREGDF
ncbi:hypothetical protein CYLTODRAFT_59538 [Cylindrobasidium torrendii FP15055 ss-10]|uniref:Uncharacterized protein n=1 Tax=Cylindrobasidium torrendii FP15055 ss-10 TaxID=1314674 RepID=A0A0D7B5S5_9AGAR|nr:hypothetical protein CYLTODRAFT_59538 [Cylindrobasidium torrendii FP15055 ss-10]